MGLTLFMLTQVLSWSPGPEGLEAVKAFRRQVVIPVLACHSISGNVPTVRFRGPYIGSPLYPYYLGMAYA